MFNSLMNKIQTAIALGAGTSYIGQVGGDCYSPTVQPVINTNIYASGDCMGSKLSLANAVRVAAGGLVISSVTIMDKDKENSALDVVFFSGDPSATTFTNNDPLDINDTDLVKIVGIVSVLSTDYVAFANNSAAFKTNLAMPFQLAAGTTLYACIVCRGTPTYTAVTDLQLTVGILPAR